MGNGMITPCWADPALASPSSSSAKLVFWEGTTRFVSGDCIAGEIMLRYPDRVVCHANSFYIGHRIPALSIEDQLSSGQTYFVLPIDCFACEVLSSKSLVSLVTTLKYPVKFAENPFQYVKAIDGRVLVKVLPEFILQILVGGKEEFCNKGVQSGSLCSTPELRKHYTMLVRSKEQVWSPKLDTISECQPNSSPSRFFGFNRRTDQKLRA